MNRFAVTPSTLFLLRLTVAQNCVTLGFEMKCFPLSFLFWIMKAICNEPLQAGYSLYHWKLSVGLTHTNVIGFKRRFLKADPSNKRR